MLIPIFIPSFYDGDFSYLSHVHIKALNQVYFLTNMCVSVLALIKVRESRLPVLSLSHLQGPFLILGAGAGLATLALVAERLR